MKKETFETELWDLITPNQREIVQSIIAYLSAEEADETEETVQKIQTNNSSIIQSISTPGYSIEFTSNPDSLGEHEKPKGIDKQGVLLEVLTERFQINRKKIYIFEEGKQQEHLNTKYSSYYVEIEGKGLVIIINNEYGQALRIKAIEPIQEEHKIVETIKTLIENKTKKQLDEDLEFITHNNTYDSTDALKALYVRIIEGEIRRESQIVEKVEKVETVETELKLTGSAAEIWNQIKGKEIINGKHSKQLNNIIDLLEMGVNYFLRGKIGNTQARDIINAILGLEGEDKIKISNNDQKTIKKSKDEIEKARTLLKVKVKAGGLGLEAKEEYEKHLEDKIELTGSAEEIWEQIKGKVIKYVRKTKKLNSIIDLLELNPTSITMGKIGETHVREIINVMLELDGDKKITWHTKKPEIIENKRRIEEALELLKQKVLAGGLGLEAKEEYEKHLNENPEVVEEEINLSVSAEEIWNQIKGKVIIYINYTNNLNSIKDLLKLNFTSIAIGKIGRTPVREIINALLGLEDHNKINTKRSKSAGEENRARVIDALELLKAKVIAGELGAEAQTEMQTIIETENIQNQIRQEIEEI